MIQGHTGILVWAKRLMKMHGTIEIHDRNGFFIFFSKDWKPTTFVTMFQAVPKKKRTKENKMKKNEKEKTTRKQDKKEKKFRSVVVYVCT